MTVIRDGRPTHGILGANGEIEQRVWPDEPHQGDIVALPPSYWEAEDLARAWRDLRAERDRRLAACDWTQMRDQGEGVAALWVPYRQALRDLPAETVDPAAPDWPEKPA